MNDLNKRFVATEVAREVDLPDCPDHGPTTRLWGHPRHGKQPPFTPWCRECGWRGEPVKPTKFVKALDITSLDGVPDELRGPPVHPAYLRQLPPEKVTYANDDH